MLNLIGIVGTNSKESTNRLLLKYMQKHFADKANIELIEVDNIPLFNKPAWLSYGIYPMVNKPVMIVGASHGALGSSRAQLHLRQILDAPELKASVMPGSEFLLPRSLQAFDENGDLRDLTTVKKLNVLFDDFRLFVKIAEKLSASQALLHKEAENFNWENL